MTKIPTLGLVKSLNFKLCFKKKAQTGDQMMIFTFMALLIIISGGIVAGVYLFFGPEYEFRESNVDALNYKVSKCIKGVDLNWSLGGDEFSKEFYSNCELNRAVVEEELFIYIEMDGVKKFDSGRGNIEECKLGDKNKNYLVCKSVTLVKKMDGVDVVFTVWTGSNQGITQRVER